MTEPLPPHPPPPPTDYDGDTAPDPTPGTADLGPQPGDPVLPPEYPDGTMLHVPDLHGTGYTDVLLRDDAEGHNDHPKPDRHWWSFHRRTWIDWPTAVRYGAASDEAYPLVRAGSDHDPWADPEQAAEQARAAHHGTHPPREARPALRRQIIDALRADTWAERHFGIYAHAGDVADTVLAALAPHLDAADRAARQYDLLTIRVNAADTRARIWEDRTGAAMGAVLDLRALAEDLLTAGRHDGARARLDAIVARLGEHA